MTFLDTALAALTGIGAFYLLEAVYYAIVERVKERQIKTWWDEWEEENWDRNEL